MNGNRRVVISGDVVKSTIITGEGRPVLTDLALSLERLSRRPVAHAAIRSATGRQFVYELNAHGLALKWDDTDERWVVYAINSGKD